MNKGVPFTLSEHKELAQGLLNIRNRLARIHTKVYNVELVSEEVFEDIGYAIGALSSARCKLENGLRQELGGSRRSLQIYYPAIAEDDNYYLGGSR